MEYKTRNDVPEKYKWDLSKMYEKDSDVEKDIEQVKKLTSEILNYKSHILDSSSNLYDFLKLTEKQDRLIEKLYVYSKMNLDVDTKNNKNKALKMKIEKLNESLNEEYAFIEPEMMNVDYEVVKGYIEENNKLNEYKFYLENFYRYKPHSLSSIEEDIYVKALNAFGNCHEVFTNIDNTDIDLGYIKDEEGNDVKLTSSNYIVYMKSKNREVRKNAFESMYNYYKSLKNTISAAYVGEIKENAFCTNVKKYNSTIERSLFNDNIDVSVYKTLIDTIHSKMNLMYDYMDVRKKLLGLDELHMYDIYVDLVESSSDKVPFEKGKEILFEALKPLGEKYLNDLKKAFEEKWIDIYPSDGKRSGAYSWGCYDSYPYLLLNYNDTVDAVSTMGHELGHSMHSYYASKTQNAINANYTIMVAEVASTVNEILLANYLINKETDKTKKAALINEQLDMIRATLYRQAMFAEFEKDVHSKIELGESLTSENLNDIYFNLVKKYFGNSTEVDDLIKYEWARIPHFYRCFYVYKYSTGITSAIVIASKILSGDKKYVEKYINMLSQGGSKGSLDLLKSVEVDLEKEETYEIAFEYFRKNLKALEELV